MAQHGRGLYETLITEALEEQLAALGGESVVGRSELHEAEAADRLALHLSRVVERAIASFGKDQRVAQGTALARQLVNVIVEATAAHSLSAERPISPAHVLRSVLGKLPDGNSEVIPTPLIPLLDTTLLTNAPGEPRVGNQVLAEIYSADRIDVVMAFIRRSGISPLLGALRAHCSAGRAVRFLTTTYTGSTEARALDELCDLGADVRVSYDETGTRLHAKAWLFHRRSGFATAYIGSSNLTHSAQVSGLEWNIRASSARNPSVVDKVAAVFETYARRLVVKSLAHRVDDLAGMRALGFCVSIEHARFMARVFCEAGVSAKAIWSDTPGEERRQALKDLAQRRVNIVFSVDLFNEGVDVPSVDTLLMLRPTDSPTLFLQQLGRGLRRYPSKTTCTVLDFIGRHRAEFRFDRRLRALLGGYRNQVAEQVEQGFPFLPAGCHMELDRVASDIVLASIRGAVPSRWSAKVQELRSLAQGDGAVPLATFLEKSGLELEDIYAGDKSWSDLCQDAGLSVQPPGPHEASLRRACGRLLHVDDHRRIETYRRLLQPETPPEPAALSASDRRLLRMIVAPIVDKAVAKSVTLKDGCTLLWAHPQVRSEMLALMDILSDRIAHVSCPLVSHPEVPLAVHARYTRIEILAAFGVGDGAKVAPWQTGVYWAKEAKADLLAFTLDKTSGQFSPTTRYRDYAISRDLIHWESQSVTRADSDTGRRYQLHAKEGSTIMLFARLRSDDRAFHFLGPATYVSHESELPMAVTWRLADPLPGDVFASFAAAVA